MFLYLGFVFSCTIEGKDNCLLTKFRCPGNLNSQNSLCDEELTLLGVRQTSVCILAVLLPTQVTLNRSFNLSEFQFAHLSVEVIIPTCEVVHSMR